MMKCLDLTLDTPAENLACDEALLNWAETSGDEVLRFWEPREYFVVVGYANKVESEVNVTACKTRNIPIFRRCSGGGTVLQGPDCLNYTLILQIAGRTSLANISCANRFIMERNREAIESEVKRRKPKDGILVCGHTDLAFVSGRPPPVALQKFSGNSQRRQKNALLFHGTFLLNFDLALVNEFLKMPSKQPDYRQQRSHSDFLTNLNVTAAEVRAAMRRVWQADSLLENPPLEVISRLFLEKYATQEWNFKF